MTEAAFQAARSTSASISVRFLRLDKKQLVDRAQNTFPTMQIHSLLGVFFALVFAQKTAAQAHRNCGINTCSDEKEEAVCGSDGVTYRNGCMLTWTACKGRTTILMIHAGPCDPCTNHECTSPINSKCKAIDGVAKCICSYTCLRTIKKVCGSNGKTYDNECEMKKHSCSLNTPVSVIKRGECGNRGSATGCAAISCPRTAICRIVAGRAKCIRRRRCRRYCPRIYRPICGTNGRTYSNQCVLERLACRYNKDIHKSYDGRCRAVHRRCIGKICPRGEICKMIRRRPKCARVCPRGCTRIYRPVCGTDGHTYSNECSLRLEACHRKSRIKVSSSGKCESSTEGCKFHECELPMVCKVISGRATCVRKVCRSSCPRVYRPVCGSDKKTYPNECELQRTACRRNENTRIEHEGRCEVVVSSTCKFKTCVFKPYSHCEVINYIPKCVCQTKCPKILRPVCGTDKKTHNNTCLLELKACNTTSRINIAHEGPCKENTCDTKNCSSLSYSVCKMIRKKPTCVCQPRCAKVYRPVCGSDNKTYPNQCMMEYTSCRRKTMITIRKKGRCQPRKTCANNTCHLYARCVDRRNGPLCVCPSRRSCLEVENKYSPVCASDGLTYVNNCTMKVMSCEDKKKVEVVSLDKCPGTCRLGSNCVSPPYSRCSSRTAAFACHCPRFCPRKYDPVCGSDGRIYGNLCTLKIYACKTNQTIAPTNFSECSSNYTCANVHCRKQLVCKDIDGQPRCVSHRCRTSCPSVSKPVCGSDGKTYDNECVLRKTECTMNTGFTKAKNGPCNTKPRETCATKTCHLYARCVDRRNGPLCVCPSRRSCLKIENKYSPVCASDGLTYVNNCTMKVMSCEDKKKVEVVSLDKCPGTCRLGSNCVSPPYSRCSSRTGAFACHCPRFCPRKYDPVCGSDGRIYGNLCTLKMYACKTNQTIAPTNFSECSSNYTCANVHCRKQLVCKDIDGQPRCVSHRCRTSCPSVSKPVCGSDGKTYDNECVLRRTECTKNSGVTKAKDGPCNTRARDQWCQIGSPCSSPPNAICSNVTGVPSCVCPRFCTMEYNLVCGSDGKTYSNPCQMRVTACTKNKTITQTDISKCETCATKTCHLYARCVDRRNGPLCVCPSRRSCLKIENKYSPVCASDGLTYVNNCTMKVMSCEDKKKVEVVSLGKCPGTCRLGSNCVSPPYSRCSSRTGAFACHCPRFCPRKYDPVCGSDGRIYGNLCTLKIYACKTNQTIAPKNFIECSSNYTCANVHCRKQLVCKDIDGQPRCVSHRCRTSCPSVSKPVCGSDGKTYDNECVLRRTECTKNSGVTKAKDGPCNTRARDQCQIGSPCSSPPNAICSNVTGVPTCVCPRFCTMEYNLVCGSDGKTYSNPCQMRVTACTKNKTITQTDFSKCGACKPGTRCNWPPYSSCRYTGPGKPSCVCPRYCPAVFRPVCGSDRRRYSNLCVMRIVACRRKKTIRQVDVRQCGRQNQP